MSGVLSSRSEELHADELVVAAALFAEVDIDGVIVVRLVMVALDVAGVDGTALLGHEHVLVVEQSLLEEKVGFPELVLLVVVQLGLGQDVPVSELAEDIDVALGEGEGTLEGEVGVDVVFGKLVLLFLLSLDVVLCKRNLRRNWKALRKELYIFWHLHLIVLYLLV